MPFAITRRSALTGLAAGLTTAPLALSATPRRPNFLFILADDHAGYVMGCDGNSQAITPHIDRLAGEGTRFSAHHCNSPVCTPSRQSFFTGQLPHAAGVTVLTTALSTGKPTLAKQFRQAGYSTAVFGKMHFNRAGEPGLHGFDIAETEDRIAKDWKASVEPRPVPPDVRVKPPWQPFKDPARIWLNSDKLPVGRFDRGMRGTYIANQAMDYMAQHRDKPFALWTSFQEPHSPYDFPLEDRGRFNPGRFGKVRQGVVTDLTEHIDVSATIIDMMGLPPLPVQHGQSLRPYLEGRAMDKPRDHIFSEYLENEEAYIKTKEWKYIFCSGKRARQDGYQTDRPTPGRYRRLYDLKNDPGEFTDVAAAHPEMVDRFAGLLLERYRATHPDREAEPTGLTRDEAIEFYLRPRDAPAT